MNLVKAFAQRQAAAAKKAQTQNGQPGAGADVASDLIKAKTKAQISTATAMQKMRHSDVKFAHEQKRKDVATKAEIRRQNSQAVAESFRSGLKTSKNGESE